MKIVIGYPPNYDLIVAALGPQPEALFCYGDTLYNPSDKKITPDVELHEGVHARQQGDNPDAWYAAYLQDRAFRLTQEIEAYGEQFAFAKETIGKAEAEANAEGKTLATSQTKLLAWGLENMALALSGESYGSLLTYGQAVSKIRNYKRIS